MTRAFLLPFLGLLLFLGACTGTTETLPATFLVVGYEAEGAGRVGLMDTALLTLDLPDTERVLATSVPLPEGSRPVASDVVDRGNLRTQLVVLSRREPNQGYISYFNLANIPVDNAAAFTLQRSFALSTETLAIAPRVADPPTGFCPTNLQVSGTGRFVAILSDAALCEGQTFNALTVIDTTTTPQPTVVVHIVNPIVIPRGFYMLQEVNRDRLFYLREGAGGAELRQLTLPTFIDIEVVRTGVPTADVRDLAPVENNLVLLAADRYRIVTRFTDQPELVEGVITTTAGSLQVVRNDFLNTPSVYIRGTNNFTVHLTLIDDNERSSPLGATDATFEAIGRFVYFVAPRRIIRFDALTYDGVVNPVFGNFGVTELETPTFITWTQAAVVAPVPTAR